MTGNTSAQDGGGISNSGPVTLNATSVTNNTATGRGGGVYSAARLNVNAGSSIINNTPTNCEGVCT